LKSRDGREVLEQREREPNYASHYADDALPKPSDEYRPSSRHPIKLVK